MQIIFIFTSIIGTLFFLLCKRRFDLFSLAYFSSLVYFLPAYFGFVYTIYGDKISLSSSTYIIMTILLSSLIISALLFDKVKVKKSIFKKIEGQHFFLTSLLLFSGLFIFLTLIGAEGLFKSEKKEIRDQLSYSFLLWGVTASLGLIHSVITKRKSYIIVFTLFLIVNLLIGNRTSIILAVMSIILFHFYRNGSKPIIQQVSVKKIFLILCFIYISFMGKIIYGSFNQGGINSVVSNLFKWENIERSFSNSEPFGRQLILETIVQTNFNLDLNYVLILLVNFIPIPISIFGFNSGIFNEKFQTTLFPNADYGMAYNFWAEGYAIKGFFGIVIFILIYNIGIALFNTMLQSDISLINTVALLMGTYWTFYIHRNSMGTIFSFEKQIFFVAIGALILSVILYIFNRGITKRVVDD
ncbi:O-antigen polymerase [Pontibacillus yanchengensis]|uniref:Oligosaccharide repeat unit polymerase n=1 Tax=Pontibacillus yanchengensis Y32 TaxID=1385514 RepID=A0A0A2TGH8_9BACI|nr:O-antigen polymerase [Pontibacillus yanchengensis]KGP74674.1 hypothetical protein N782_00325 [Pontibacillus yanchengensis Y32]